MTCVSFTIAGIHSNANAPSDKYTGQKRNESPAPTFTFCGHTHDSAVYGVKPTNEWRSSTGET